MTSTLQTQAFPGAPGGMNTALPQSEIDDTEARYIQDGFVDYPGRVRRRGPVQAVATVTNLDHKATAPLMTLNPNGQDRYAALNGDNANGYFTVWSADLSAKVNLAWPHPLPADPAGSAATAYRHWDAKASSTGGLWVGVSSAYDSNSPNQGLAFWKGATKANYTTGTLTVARGSASVTGIGTGWLANADPGSFLFASTDDGYTQTLIGTVLSVNGDTSITLQQVSPYPVTAKAYTLQSIRGFAPKVVKGDITCDVSAKTVNGGDTKFADQGLGVGSWNIYRRRDLAWVGKVDGAATITNTSVTLVANAAISMADEGYVAIRADSDYSITTTANVNKVGFLTASFADRQWFANNGAQFDKTYRLWFSDANDPEGVDLTEAGDWIPIRSNVMAQEPIKAMMAAQNGLIVLKEKESFIVQGSTPDDFAARKLEDDGVLSGMSVQPYNGGVLWAGRDGIHFYDGIQTTNMTELKLGDVWKNSVKSFDPSRYRMGSMVARNHYFLFIEKLAPTLSVVKGVVSSTPDRWTVALNMETGAVTLLTNVPVRGAVNLPANSGKAVWYLVNDATRGYLVDAYDLFDLEGIDVITGDGGVLGPDFYFESKKFDAGDPLRLKRFKHLLLHYLAQGGDIEVDTVLGLNNVGKTLAATFPASVYTWSTLRASVATWTGLRSIYPTWKSVIQGVFEPKRVRFLKKSQHMSFRLYQSSSAMSRLQIGPFEIGFKQMRPGRV